MIAQSLLQELGIEESPLYRDETHALATYYREVWHRSELRAAPIEPRDFSGGGARRSAESRRAQIARLIYAMRNLNATQRACLDAHFGLGQSYTRMARLGKVLRTGLAQLLWDEFRLDFDGCLPRPIARMRTYLPENAKTIGYQVRCAKAHVRAALERAGLFDREKKETWERIPASSKVYRRPVEAGGA